MTSLTPAQKERLRSARSRAGHIRYGMQTIADTWVYIARARVGDLAFLILVLGLVLLLLI